ncbi:hypothetical protein Lqui_2148 [Legionella quinlivanii]|uniref:Uncharacterized protein n=1 Tax=Legionella quinlivanii TaxID=45073 RepID=A0A0W0XTE8_9GAMM|nr:hypothetical protein [Legionella quinlivanii]KTD47884.1 hypothetical protein Lqui_2148 [Legionella quinlivanii]SEG37367.1 hypothetical protein SAMN02746093_02709 [Legionella quinlivanii DSM 21216]STY10122.1 Uncharacterised protein [Legionella quinlivanii]
MSKLEPPKFLEPFKLIVRTTNIYYEISLFAEHLEEAKEYLSLVLKDCLNAEIESDPNYENDDGTTFSFEDELNLIEAGNFVCQKKEISAQDLVGMNSENTINIYMVAISTRAILCDEDIEKNDLGSRSQVSFTM